MLLSGPGGLSAFSQPALGLSGFQLYLNSGMPVYKAEKRNADFKFKFITSFKDEIMRTDTAWGLWIIAVNVYIRFSVL